MAKYRKYNKRVTRRQSVCLRKRRFASYSAAMDAMFALAAATKDDGLKVYRCPFCNAFHFGHPRKYE